MLASGTRWPWALLLLLLLPALVSTQIETADVDRPELYECVVGNVAATSRRAAAAAAPAEVPSVEPAAMVQATTAALQTAGVKVISVISLNRLLQRLRAVSFWMSEGSLPENVTNRANALSRGIAVTSSY
jgi:hypothetical protein